MRLSDVGMIAADTSRTKAYLQALSRNDLCPGHILVLSNSTEDALAGQAMSMRGPAGSRPIRESEACWREADIDFEETLEVTLKRMQASAEVMNCTDVNHADVIQKVRDMPQRVLIYSGYGGVLLRNDILSTGKKFLHVHGGYLPDYKGSTTSYYSLLTEGNLGASSLFLSAQIDGGPVLQRRKFPPPADRLAIDHIYDSAARAQILVDTLESYVATGSWNFEVPENTGGETYYVIHPVLKHVAILAEPKANQCD